MVKIRNPYSFLILVFVACVLAQGGGAHRSSAATTTTTSVDDDNFTTSLVSSTRTTNTAGQGGTTTASVSTATSTSSSSAGSSQDRSPPSGNGNGTPIYNHTRTAHAVIGCVTFALLFPIGASLLRILSSHLSLKVHMCVQVTAVVGAFATMGMGLYMAIVSEQLREPHSIIGLVAVCLIFFQPLTGYAHHLMFKRTGGRTPVSWVHWFVGTALITMGIVDGGLGLELSHEARWKEIIFGIIAGLIWVLWIQISLAATARKTWAETEVVGETGATKDVERTEAPRENAVVTEAAPRSYTRSPSPARTGRTSIVSSELLSSLSGRRSNRVLRSEGSAA